VALLLPFVAQKLSADFSLPDMHSHYFSSPRACVDTPLPQLDAQMPPVYAVCINIRSQSFLYSHLMQNHPHTRVRTSISQVSVPETLVSQPFLSH